MRVALIESLPANWTAWSGLRLFQNEEWVAERLIEKHNLIRDQEHNARKQAGQIAFCLSQAAEYWQAAKSSSQATAHLQLYYCCMSLALAKVLWKGDGNFAIERLRQNHGHHGLSFVWGHGKLLLSSLSELKVKPHQKEKVRSGTFEVWHSLARESYLIGETQNRIKNIRRVEALFYPGNKRLPIVPENGISLETLYSSLPRMTAALNNVGLSTRTLRATFSREIQPSPFPDFDIQETYTVDIHPTEESVLEEFRSKVSIRATYLEDTEILERSQGFTIRQTSYASKHGSTGGLELPDGISMSPGATYFKPYLPHLNEFGIIYCTSYLLGMLCRYYPDLWMREIKSKSSFMYLAEAFFEFALDRIPILCLTALEECAYVKNDTGLKV